MSLSKSGKRSDGRRIKAFQYDHPELHKYYVDAARTVINDAGYSADSGNYSKRVANTGNGNKRYTTQRVSMESSIILEARDMDISRPQLIQACEDIIANHGQENYAVAKRVEILLDKVLSDGYTTSYGEQIAPNSAYMAAKSEIAGGISEAEYRARQSQAADDFVAAVEGDSGTVQYMSRTQANEDEEILHLVDQIIAHGDELDAKSPVADITVSIDNVRTISEKRAWIEQHIKTSQVDRQGVGIIHLGKQQINKGLTYVKTDGDLAGFAALPSVLKRGDIIERHGKHKGNMVTTDQPLKSMTIAGKIVINGKPGILAAIVKETKGNRYAAHKVRMPDGSVFVFANPIEIGESRPGPAHGTTENSRLDVPTVSALDESIQDNDGGVNTENGTVQKQLRDSSGNQLTAAQAEYFKDSKIRDKDGNLKVMYHGTEADFTIFNTQIQGGKNGTAEGYGIYFSDDQKVTAHYGQRQMQGYLDIKHPATSDKKTIKAPVLTKLIEATCKAEAERIVESDGYGNANEAIKDTWISNYVNTYDMTMQQAYRKAADMIINGTDSDMETVQEVMSGMAIRDYAAAYEFYPMLTEITGIDGFVTKWENDQVGKPSQVVLAFNSNQFKSIDNANPTSNPDIQKQQRTKTFSNREVLEMASDEINRESLTEGQRDALITFDRYLDRLHWYENVREEINANIAQARETGDEARIQNEMKRREENNRQIAKVEKVLLQTENTKVAKQLINRARNIVEARTEQEVTERLEAKYEKRIAELEDWAEQQSRTELRHKIVKMKDDFDKMLNAPAKANSKHAPQELMRAVSDLCSVFNSSAVE